MSTAEQTLIKANPLLPAEDFEALRREGIRHIEKLGSKMWTDYNTSDPGITILEAVCYAITDLAYRTGFEMKDLLAPTNLTQAVWKKIFYTARQILHNNPLTITDYRKVIIDIEGVRNAWIEMSKDYEVPVFVDYSYVNEEGKSDCGCEEKEPCLGKLGLELADSEARKKAIEDKIIEIDAQIKKLQDEINANDPKTDKERLTREIERLVTVKNVYNNALKYIDQSKILEIEGLFNVMVEYEEDVLEDKQRDAIRDRVLQKLHENRNLCEDFLSVNAVEYEDFSVLGLFVLKEDANPEEVFAKICFEIYRYFTPRVSFYTIEEMMQKINPENNQPLSVEEIFEGPPLRSGFIDSAELEKSDLFRDFRLSDVINSISDIEGIEAIPNLYIPFDAMINPVQDLDDVSVFFNDWIRLLRRERKIARLKLKGSRFVFLKKRDVTTYDFTKEDPAKNRAVRRFEDLKTQDQQYKLKGHQKDFPVPVGEYMELEDYYPVQYSLPKCYGVGEYDELPEYPTETRDVQSYQLKGFLLFFEQILVNYHAQLNHLRDIFSFDENVEHNSFIHVLHEITNLKELLLDHDPQPGETKEHFFEEFTHILQDLVEPREVFLKKRNAILDHLLARFGEDLSEYEALTKYVWKKNTAEKLIGDKIRLLQDYVKVSKNRSEGLNYTLPDQVWDTDNISGAERRIGRLLGFGTVERHSLAVSAILIEEILEEKTKKDAGKTPKGTIRLVNPYKDNELLLTSRPINMDDCCIDQTINSLLDLAETRSNFFINGKIKSVPRNKAKKEQTGTFRIELKDKDGDIVAYSHEYGTYRMAEEAIDAIIEIVRTIDDNEGMHLVEHLLLRPRLDTVLEYADYNLKDDITPPQIPVEMLDICLDDCDLGKGLGQGVGSHSYRFKISRLPADKCYNDEAWVVELIRVEEIKKTIKIKDSKGKIITKTIKLPAGQSILFNQIGLDNTPKIPDLLSFKKYDQLQERLADLREFGSEKSNYQILRYSDDVAEEGEKEDILYYFEIYDVAQNRTLARSIYYQTKPEAEVEIDALVQFLGYELDLYCEADPCDHNEDPYSFRVTIVLPCWVRRFRDKNYRYFVEKTIRTELPAHIAPRIKWVGVSQMQLFEEKYLAWLEELLNNSYPEYPPVNEFVKILNNIRECGYCEPGSECMQKEDESGSFRYTK